MKKVLQLFSIIVLSLLTFQSFCTVWEDATKEILSIEESLKKDIQNLKHWTSEIENIFSIFDQQDQQRIAAIAYLKKEFSNLKDQFAVLLLAKDQQETEANAQIENLKSQLSKDQEAAAKEIDKLQKELTQALQDSASIQETLTTLQAGNQEGAATLIGHLNSMRSQYDAMSAQKDLLTDVTKELLERIKLYQILNSKELKELEKAIKGNS